MYEIEANEKHAQLNQKRFTELKKTLLSQIAKAEFESQRYTKEIEEQSNESIPQAEKEIEQKKEARRNIEKQIREIKDGKGNAQSQIDAIVREKDQTDNKIKQLEIKASSFTQ